MRTEGEFIRAVFAIQKAYIKELRTYEKKINELEKKYVVQIDTGEDAYLDMNNQYSGLSMYYLNSRKLKQVLKERRAK